MLYNEVNNFKSEMYRSSKISISLAEKVLKNNLDGTSKLTKTMANILKRKYIFKKIILSSKAPQMSSTRLISNRLNKRLSGL